MVYPPKVVRNPVLTSSTQINFVDVTNVVTTMLNEPNLIKAHDENKQNC